MGILRYLAHDLHSAIELDELEERLNQMRSGSVARTIGTAKRVQELELDLMKVAMVARAMAELCIKKGLFTDREFMDQLAEADFADGVADGGLDPKLVEPGRKRLAALQPADAEPLDAEPPRKPPSERVAKILKERNEKKQRGKS